MADTLSFIPENEVGILMENFGMTLETHELNSESEIYLKYRFFPTEKSISNCCFEEIGTLYTDTFFDTAASDENFIYTFGRRGTFYRCRNGINESDAECVKQITCDGTSKYHHYVETPVNKIQECTEHNLHPFLRFSFKRYVSQIEEGVYMDCFDDSDLRKYAVITISRKVDSCDNVLNIAKHVLRRSLALENPAGIVINDIENKLLQDTNLVLTPAYSKFMFAIQMSEHFEAYFDIFMAYDPAAHAVAERIDVANENDSTPCYCKEYLWTVQTQIVYFHSLLQHSKNKKRDATSFLEHVSTFENSLSLASDSLFY